jgi:hypothetical protein
MSPEDRKELITELMDQLKTVNSLTDDEQRWVRMAIEREAQSIALRKAIIEKTITSLIWMLLAGIGYIFLDFLREHGFK